MSELATPGRTPVDFPLLQRRVLALGGAALEGTRDLSDVLGDAFQELRNAVASIRDLQVQLQDRDELLSALRAELEAERRRGAESATPLVPVGPPLPAVEPSAPAPRPADPGEADAEHEAVDLLQGPIPANARALAALLRERIAGALYLGILGPGDRLPSIRDLSRRSGLNHKTIRRVYQDLERRGLVTVRDRSGIYVNETEPSLAESLEETEAWVARVVVEASERGVPAGELPGLLRGWTASRPLRCACVESSEDDRFALCSEIAERFGVMAVPVGTEPQAMARALREVDFVVTTPFHAAEVRAALGPLRPLVVTGPAAQLRARVRQGAERGDLVLACVDPGFAERLLHGIPVAHPPRVRVVLLGASEGAAELPEGTGVASLAARQRLRGGVVPPHVSVPAYLTARAAHDIAGLVVRLNRVAAAE